MSSKRKTLLGFVLWEGAKWHVRRRLPSRRRLLMTGLLAGAGVMVLAAIARRSS